MGESRTPFHDLNEYVALARVTGLVLSPDGGRLVATVQQASKHRDRYVTSLWEIDPAGVTEARRLTRSEQGETSPVFAADGSLLFCSKRPAPGEEPADQPALWRLPRQGEAERVATSPGGVTRLVTAAEAPVYVAMTSRLLDADEADRQWREDRRRSKVTAIIHDGFPIRHWDHELGPDYPRLLVGRPDDETAPRDLAPDAGRALHEADFAITRDGSLVVTTWSVREPRGRTRTGLTVIEVATGDRRTLVDEPGVAYRQPVISPDGRWVATLRRVGGDFDTLTELTLCVYPLAGGEPRSHDLLEELWPTEYVWSPDSATLYVAGDRLGRGAVVALDPM